MESPSQRFSAIADSIAASMAGGCDGDDALRGVDRDRRALRELDAHLHDAGTKRGGDGKSSDVLKAKAPLERLLTESVDVATAAACDQKFEDFLVGDRSVFDGAVAFVHENAGKSATGEGHLPNARMAQVAYERSQLSHAVSLPRARIARRVRSDVAVYPSRQSARAPSASGVRARKRRWLGL